MVARPSLRTRVNLKVRGSVHLWLHCAVLPAGRTGTDTPPPRGPAWQLWQEAAALGGRGSHPNTPLAWPLEPVGPCLYLVTLGGFASPTGIWHPRWKISLVRSPWKQAEPLRRFTLNGARPACIRCPVCLEFPPRLLRPLCRPGVSLLEGLAPLPLDAGSLERGLPSTRPLQGQPTTPPTGLASPQAGCGHLTAGLPWASWRGSSPQQEGSPDQGPAPAHPDPLASSSSPGRQCWHCPAALGATGESQGAGSSWGVGFAFGERGPEATLLRCLLCTGLSHTWWVRAALASAEEGGAVGGEEEADRLLPCELWYPPFGNQPALLGRPQGQAVDPVLWRAVPFSELCQLLS